MVAFERYILVKATALFVIPDLFGKCLSNQFRFLNPVKLDCNIRLFTLQNRQDCDRFVTEFRGQNQRKY